MPDSALKKILIIEDDKLLSDLFKKVLDGKNFKVSQALSAQEGISLFVREHPDLIILDLLLPDQDGLEVLRQIRQSNKSQVPVIVLSNVSDTAEMSKAEALSIVDYIIKIDPNSLHELEDDIDKALKIVAAKHDPNKPPGTD